MKWVFVGLLSIHGLIHLMGPAKAFGLAELEALTAPIGRGLGLIWLAAAMAMLEGRWHPEGEQPYTYLELELLGLTVNDRLP